MKNLLFVCLAAMDRSPTAASLFEGSKKYNAKFAGISPTAEIRITGEAVKWADVIFTMDLEQKLLITNRFPEAKNKEIIVLDVSNDFTRNDPELAELLRIKLEKEGFL